MRSLDKSFRILTERLIITGFLLTLILPLLGYACLVTGLGPRESQLEAHQEAGEAALPLLKPTLRSVLAFPNELRNHFQRHFGFRKELIRAHGLLKVKALGVSSTPRAVVGQQGWLYYAEEESIESYRCLKPFTADQLERWKRTLEARRDWLAEQGSAYVFVVVPDKHTIYPEYLPRTIKRAGVRTRLDQLIDYLTTHSRVPVVDLRPALIAAKRGARIYQKTDTHWNDLGAYVGYREVARKLAGQLSDMAPLPRSHFVERSEWASGGDLARFLGLQDVIREERLELRPLDVAATEMATERAQHLPVQDMGYEPLVITRCATAPIERAVIFRDSFASQMMPYLARHFRKATFVWTEDFDARLVQQERPKVVIQQFVERKLMRLEPAGQK